MRQNLQNVTFESALSQIVAFGQRIIDAARKQMPPETDMNADAILMTDELVAETLNRR